MVPPGAGEIKHPKLTLGTLQNNVMATILPNISQISQPGKFELFSLFGGSTPADPLSHFVRKKLQSSMLLAFGRVRNIRLENSIGEFLLLSAKSEICTKDIYLFQWRSACSKAKVLGATRRLVWERRKPSPWKGLSCIQHGPNAFR